MAARTRNCPVAGVREGCRAGPGYPGDGPAWLDLFLLDAACAAPDHATGVGLCFYNSGDFVTDFVKGTDRIVIDEIPFTRPGIINFQFVSNGNFTSHASNIIQVSYIYVDNGFETGVNTLVLADFDSTVGADAKLELRGQFTLSSSDFSFF